MNNDWANRDDWDGAEWAEMFSGPDDGEFERIQNPANPMQTIATYDNHGC